jgi:hypothetical protein
LFGGVQVIVPETWRVEQRMVAFLGGVSDSREKIDGQETGPVLRLDGWAAFGGIDLKSDPQRDEFVAESPAAASA